MWEQQPATWNEPAAAPAPTWGAPDQAVVAESRSAYETAQDDLGEGFGVETVLEHDQYPQQHTAIDDLPFRRPDER